MAEIGITPRLSFVENVRMYIRTILEAIAPEELGITPGHEYLLIDLRGLWVEPPVE